MSDEPSTSDTSNSLNAHNAPIALTPAQREVKQKKFLKVYREVGIIKAACEAVRINRATFYYWRDHDEAFKAQLPDARIDANESLEIMAYDQARGIEEPAVSMGKIVYEEIPVTDDEGNQKFNKSGHPIMKRGKMVMVKKYSPSVLITLLKANMPEKYKERVAQEHTGKNGGPIEVVDPDRVTLEQKLEAMRASIEAGKRVLDVDEEQP